MKFLLFALLLSTILIGENTTPPTELPPSIEQGQGTQEGRRRRRRNTRGYRILAIKALDQGSTDPSGEGDLSIDVEKDSCNDGSDEPFNDTLLAITVRNSTGFIGRFRSSSYTIFNGNSDGSNIRGKKIALAQIGEVQPTSDGTILALFLDTTIPDRKRAVGQSDPIRTDLGIANVRVNLRGIDSSGKRIRVNAKPSFSFRNVDRCN